MNRAGRWRRRDHDVAGTAHDGRSLAETTDRLCSEFAATLDRATVTRVVRSCRRDLRGSPAGALSELVERLARADLADRAPWSAGASPAAIHLLVFETGGRHGTGWVLESWHDSRRGRSEQLAARGAGPEACPRLAQAVATRLLIQAGAPVAGWHLAGAEDLPVFRASVRCPAGPARHRRHRATAPG